MKSLLKLFLSCKPLTHAFFLNLFSPPLLILVLFSGCESAKESGGENIPTQSHLAHASVVSVSKDASQAGLAILKKGGNAIDAAITVQFALAVSHPYAGNIGGGGFMVIRLKDGSAATLDFRETAPAAATKNMFLDAKGNLIADLKVEGHLSAGVPGSVDGMIKAHEKYGSLPWKELLQPSIDLANHGFSLSEREANLLNQYQEKFSTHNPGKNYLLKSGGWKTGDLLIQKDLGKTLERIRDLGRGGFYEGETAELIVQEMKSGKGILSREDLKNYQSKWRAPLVGKYKGYKIITMGPPSSGGICLLQILGMVQNKNLSQSGFHTTKTVHLLTEAERRVYADRSEFLGDPDFVNINLSGLLDSLYLQNRIAEKFNENGIATASSSIGHGNPPKKESEETTHFSIVDEMGNAVSVTTTVNAPFGSLVFVKGAGFLLNDEMDDFSAKPGVPDQFGLLTNEANAIAPGKRMLSAMTPVIAEKNGKLFLVLGSPGGSTIITTVLQVFLNVVEFGQSLPDAVSSGRFHHQWMPDLIYMEADALPKSVVDGLSANGHKIKVREAIGSVDAILVEENGNLLGFSDPRRMGTALSY